VAVATALWEQLVAVCKDPGPETVGYAMQFPVLWVQLVAAGAARAPWTVAEEPHGVVLRAGLAWGSWWVPLKHVQILAGVHFFNNKADFAQKIFEAPVTSTRARVGGVPTPAPRWHVSRGFFPGKPLILLGNRFPPKGTFWQNSDFWIFRICLFPHSENLRTDVHPHIRKETNP
jgi:hypothetical protein